MQQIEVPPELRQRVRRGGRLFALVIAALAVLFVLRPFAIVPAGHVGVKDLLGIVSPNTLPPGLHLIVPFTRVVRMSMQTQNLVEAAETPSKEGLSVNLDVSLLYRIDPAQAVSIYKTVGRDYERTIVEPQLRSAVREVTASYEAKVLYSAERERIAREIFAGVSALTRERGIVVEQLLLRKIGLPPIVAGAIQEKLKREQEAEQMKFVLQKEQQEAERKRIEAQGIADFQKIVAQGISDQLLEWKGIEATEKLALSPNSKIVVIGNPKSGLPIILSGEK